MGAYDRIWWNGEKFNRRTVNMLQEAERRFGSKFIYYQGSYNSGVSASAGTHDGGGAVDLWTYGDEDKAVRILRSVGFAAWDRTGRGNWTPHIHAIAIGDKQMSSGARSQVTAYYNGRDGLAGNGPDYHWRPDPIRVWGKNVGPGTREPQKVNWFVIKRQLAARVPTHKWAVRVLQRELNKAGFDVVIDGKAGPQTRRAFKRYRERTGLGPFNAARRLLLPKFRAVRPDK